MGFRPRPRKKTELAPNQRRAWLVRSKATGRYLKKGISRSTCTDLSEANLYDTAIAAAWDVDWDPAKDYEAVPAIVTVVEEKP